MKGTKKTKNHLGVAPVAMDIVSMIVETATTVADRISDAPQHNHGPLVKSGPTAGKNRSRNKNGRWRAKRSDAGKKRK